MIIPLPIEYSMRNTSESLKDAEESFLSQILQDAPPIKYYLSPKACLGILRRASERGKALPPKLERALKIQAGLMRPDGQPTDLNAFHINQRDEGIDLHGVSGALMATTNMQMQTFVTQPDDTVVGFDGYNGDLTGDVAATLGVNCGMSTGRNGIMAFAANQRDEVRDLHDVAGALGAQQGMKQQTFVAAGFSAGAGASAGSIGYGEELAPTLKGSASGNCMPSVLCLNDQGGSVMECSENVSGTLRAQEHGHQPLVYENHGIDSRTFAGTCNRPEIAYISHSVEHNKKRIFSLLKQERNKIFRFLISHRRNEGDHSLMIFPGNTVDTLYRNTLNRYQRTFQSCKKLLGKITLNIFLHEDLIYLFSSLKGFYHGTNAENHFTFI